MSFNSDNNALRELLFGIPILQSGKLRLREFQNHTGTEKVGQQQWKGGSARPRSNAAITLTLEGFLRGDGRKTFPLCFSSLDVPLQLKAGQISQGRSPSHGPAVPPSLSSSVLSSPTLSPLLTFLLVPSCPQSPKLQPPFSLSPPLLM